MMDNDSMQHDKKRGVIESLRDNDLVRHASKYFFLVVGFIVFYALIYRFDPYQTVDGRITKAEQLCDFYRPKNKTGWPQEWEHKPVPPGSTPCGAAEERKLDRKSEIPVRRYFVLFVEYVSPSDGRTYSQRIQIAAERLPPDVSPGMTIKLSASKINPYSVRGE
jgi:hypothetical protein